MKLFLYPVLVILSATLATPASADKKLGVETVSLCELGAYPDKYDGKIVRVVARVEAMQPDFRTSLVDPSCFSSAVAMMDADGRKNKSQLAAFHDVILGIHDGVAGTSTKAVEATVVGKFSKEEVAPVVAPVLYAMSITNVRVRYGVKSLVPSKPSRPPQ